MVQDMSYAFKTESNIMSRASQREICCVVHEVSWVKKGRVSVSFRKFVYPEDKRRAAVADICGVSVYAGNPQIAALKLP